jgi:uncharacterized membrane protein
VTLQRRLIVALIVVALIVVGSIVGDLLILRASLRNELDKATLRGHAGAR